LQNEKYSMHNDEGLSLNNENYSMHTMFVSMLERNHDTRQKSLKG
jgi:hypothetical protein